MKLGDYLKREKMTQARFAKLAGTNQAHISELVHGKVSPTLDTIAKITDASLGCVTLQDWAQTVEFEWVEKPAKRGKKK